ncbi:MAG: hypothetical protein QMD36_01430 [Candidatus Aenigmarchaeota archaeon]|nr:hypothetical protein [Candidatus Aenigmarchaeota archaeon]
MKGLALNYLFLLLIVVVFIVVGIGILRYFYGGTKLDQNEITYPMDVRYTCIQINNTEISFQDFQDVLYGFLTGQCNDFSAKTSQRMTLSDVNRAVKAIDSSVEVIKINECMLPSVNTHTVYLNFSEIEEGRNIYLARREIDDSDVLICG